MLGNLQDYVVTLLRGMGRHQRRRVRLVLDPRRRLHNRLRAGVLAMSGAIGEMLDIDRITDIFITLGALLLVVAVVALVI